MIITQSLNYAHTANEQIDYPDFACKFRENLLILGRSGSGKSTLLHLLSGILRGYQGSIKINDLELSLLSNKKMDLFRAKNIGIIFQRPFFIPSLSIEENLYLCQKLAGLKVDHKRISQLLEKLDIKNKRNKKISELSLGELQRIGIIRAILNKPLFILADEPTSSLDDYNCESVINLLKEQVDENHCSLVVVSHDQRIKKHFNREITI